MATRSLMNCLTIRRRDTHRESVITFPSDKQRLALHPTQKPLAIEWLISTYTNAGDTVLDNCMGSGTTVVACEYWQNPFGIEKGAITMRFPSSAFWKRVRFV